MYVYVGAVLYTILSGQDTVMILGRDWHILVVDPTAPLYAVLPVMYFEVEYMLEHSFGMPTATIHVTCPLIFTSRSLLLVVCYTCKGSAHNVCARCY